MEGDSHCPVLVPTHCDDAPKRHTGIDHSAAIDAYRSAADLACNPHSSVNALGEYGTMEVIWSAIEY